MLVGGCQVILDVDKQQCDSDRDCVGLFGRSYVCSEQRVCVDQADAPAPSDADMPDLPDNWACLEEPPRMVLPQLERTVDVRLAVTDFVDLVVPAGLTGKACNPTDLGCANPLIEGVEPDADGYIEFEDLPHGWRGHYELSADGYVDSLVYTNRPYTEETRPGEPTMLKPSTLDDIAEGGGEQIDHDKGIAIVTVFDCDGNAAAGVRFEQEDTANEDPEPAFYFEGTFPDRNRTTTTISMQLTRSMSPTAAGGFSQITPGYVTLIAILDATGQEVGRVSVQIRALTMTFAEINAGY